MKKLFTFLILSIAIISCGNSDIDGRGTNPRLNLESYTVGKEGGSFKVYSKIGYFLQIYPKYDITKPIDIKYEKGIRTIKGEWYKIVQHDFNDTLYITMEPNTSDTTRIIPLTIMSGNYGIQPKYGQK